MKVHYFHEEIIATNIFREWAGHMSVLYLLHQLVENHSANLDLLRNVDWVVVPVVNPDGYVYTHTNVCLPLILSIFL